MIYGIIDIGSNTIRLCAYKVDGDGFKLLFNEKVTAGLASYVEKGTLSKKGIAKAVETLSAFSAGLLNFEMEAVFPFATASLRNISNTDEAVCEIKKQTGFLVDVLSGEDEARLDFLGATHFAPATDGLLIDIGGASTELVAYEGKNILEAVSLPLGSLNLYRAYVEELLPTKEERDLIEKVVKKQLKKLPFKDNSYKLVCGIGGSVRAAAKLANEQFGQVGANKCIEPKQIRKVIKALSYDDNLSMQKILQIVPERIHTAIPGMVVLNTIVKHFNCEEIIVSSYGVREGYLLEQLSKRKSL